MHTGLDGGLQIEFALRDAVDKSKNFRNFADVARTWFGNLPLSAEEKEYLLRQIAKEIKEFPG